jgi:hypothetical protein
MMRTLAIWHSDDPESAYKLIAAIDNNCTCERNGGTLIKPCGAHAMMLNQHFLDWLLWMRWRYLREEGETPLE